jgi:ribosomal protein S27E
MLGATTGVCQYPESALCGFEASNRILARVVHCEDCRAEDCLRSRKEDRGTLRQTRKECGAVLQVLKGGKALTAHQIAEAIESQKLLGNSTMEVGTCWILRKLKKSEVIVSA